MIIQHNIEAMNAMNCFGRVNKSLSKSTEKLSSGYKINRAADDAAGLTISEKMRWQIRGLNRATRNINDGISYCNVAEGALGEIHSMLERMKELSVQAANDTNTDSDREALDKENQQLKDQIDKIFEDTMFNTQKIWCAAYIPSSDGNPTDFAFYNATDANGTYIGGIEYMNHRYSWEDLGIDYDKNTRTFTETNTYKIDGNILKDDASSSIDDYTSSASFSIRTVKGESLDKAQKMYSWRADTDGIAIDGIITKGNNSREGNTTWAAMGLTPGQDVQAGTYKFNYYGMEVSFTVKEKATWTTFTDGINNPRVSLDWHSDNVGANYKQSADILGLYNDHIIVKNATKDRFRTDGYNIEADDDKIGIRYFDKIIKYDWSTLTDTKGYSSIKSWGEDRNGGNSKSDKIGTSDDSGSSNVTIYDESEYEYNDSGDDGIMGFKFKLDETGSSSSIIRDLNNTIISVTTTANTKADVKNSAQQGTAEANTSATASSHIDFLTQRDILERQFNTPDEKITDGKISIDNGNTVVKLNAKGGVTYDLTYEGDVRDRIAAEIKYRKESLEKAALEKKKQGIGQGIPEDSDVLAGNSIGFTFTNIADKHDHNNVNVNYDISNITYGDIKNMTTDAEYMELADKIFMANSDITISADGDAYQDLTLYNDDKREARIKNGVMVDGFVMDLYIQSGALGNQGIDIQYDYLRASNLGLGGISLKTRDDSSSAINQVDKAIDKVSEQRSLFGAYTNRLEHAYSVNSINSENTQSAESRLRDTDMAQEMMEYSKNNILSQVGQSILAQCNQNKNQVIQLLQ